MEYIITHSPTASWAGGFLQEFLLCSVFLEHPHKSESLLPGDPSTSKFNSIWLVPQEGFPHADTSSTRVCCRNETLGTQVLPVRDTCWGCGSLSSHKGNYSSWPQWKPEGPQCNFEISISSVASDAVVKNLPANAGDLLQELVAGLVPGLGRSPGAGNDSPLWYSCPEKSRGQRGLVGYSPWDHGVGQDWEHTGKMIYTM